MSLNGWRSMSMSISCMESGQRRPYQVLRGRHWTFPTTSLSSKSQRTTLVTRPGEVSLARSRPVEHRRSTKRHHQEQGPPNVLAEKSWPSTRTSLGNTFTTIHASHEYPIVDKACAGRLRSCLTSLDSVTTSNRYRCGTGPLNQLGRWGPRLAAIRLDAHSPTLLPDHRLRGWAKRRLFLKFWTMTSRVSHVGSGKTTHQQPIARNGKDHRPS